MSLGHGAVYSTSNRQKLVSRSSTEAELVGLHDVMPEIVWTRLFLEAQGLELGASTIYQDNKSAILLEENGRSSSGKRTRHINIRYFFIKDRINSNEVTVKYCPTSEMIADFFTKPLQGALFRKFRDFIMNIDPDNIHHQDHRSVLTNEIDGNKTQDNTDESKQTDKQSYRTALLKGVNRGDSEKGHFSTTI